jgi:hypothetical protein
MVKGKMALGKKWPWPLWETGAGEKNLSQAASY